MKNKHLSRGFSVIEVVLAAALFMLFSTAAVGVVLQGFNANRLGAEETIANQFAAEGMEAVKSIKNQAYSNLVNTAGCSLNRVSNVWVFDSPCATDTLTHNSGDNYIRTIKVESVNRDGSGNIVSSGGTLDPDTKKITSTVSWNFNSARPESVVLTTYLSDWRKPIVTNRGGILVYGDGGSTTDAIKYRILNTDGTWGGVTTFPDFDTSTSNKALRAIRAYSSATRNEKIVLSRHYNGSAQFIYAHRWNGTSWTSWQFATWATTTFLDVHNFDGAYLNNGDFIAAYSDNTAIPKYRIWNGSSWTPNPPAVGSSVSTGVGDIPNNIVVKNRPGTNEALLATYDQQSDTNTSYYNGSTWSTAVEHATQSPTNTDANHKEFVDFTWSAQTTSKGALIYASGNSDNSMQIKICTAPCTAAANWSAAVQTTTQGTLGAMEMDSRKGAEEYIACDKDASNDIICFRGNNTPTWVNPTNRTITANTDTGIQRSFDFTYEATSGTEGLIVYSETASSPVNPNLPRWKVYNTSTNTFDLNESDFANTLNGALKTVKMRPLADNDDIMIMMGDGSTPPRFYTVVWDGTNNALYTTPSGKAFTAQGTNGSNPIEYWYGFAWDRF